MTFPNKIDMKVAGEFSDKHPYTAAIYIIWRCFGLVKKPPADGHRMTRRTSRNFCATAGQHEVDHLLHHK